MQPPTTIKLVEPSDLNKIKTVIDTSGLFPSELLDDMIAGYFDHSEECFWLTGEGESPTFVAYVAPERMTEGTWNLYLIAVHEDLRSQGIGKIVMDYIETLLVTEKKARILLVETSDLPEFERTRSFYDQCKYIREAVIRDFYQAGGGKVIFWKKLQ